LFPNSTDRAGVSADPWIGRNNRTTAANGTVRDLRSEKSGSIISNAAANARKIGEASVS
jgi:hypothetical protein